MKICIAQTKSLKGEVRLNMENHIRIIRMAIEENADLIVFPELSITGYEPELANKLAVEIHDELFLPFQDLADENDVVIGLGMPTKTIDGINISMLIFQKDKDRIVYSKRILHADELPYFVSGTKQPFLQVKGKKIGIGICYETLQRAHIVNAVENKADIYIASVAKNDKGISNAYLHFPSMAKEFSIPILMSNCVGYCDNFLSNGESSVWNEEGKLIQQLNEVDQGLIIFEADTNQVHGFQLKNDRKLSEY